MREIKSTSDKIPGFPYRLLEWQPKRRDVIFAIFTFKKYKEEDEAAIVKTPLGWSIFTKKRLGMVYPYMSPYKRRVEK